MATNGQQDQVTYGQLVVLGYNGHLSRGNHGRIRSKWILKKRVIPNGIKLSRNCTIKSSRSTSSPGLKHSITFSLSKSMTVVAEYVEDKDTDMFQIGRSSATPIDCVILDKSARKKDVPESSTISRFACRILVDRRNPKIARIFAAGFNDSKSVVLGEKALKWKKDDETMDGLTTNGVFISHPKEFFCGGESQYGYWREVSVGGEIYSLREDRTSRHMAKFIETEDNILKDGTLINLCGATLLWRTDDGLRKTPDKYDIEDLVGTINEFLPGVPTKMGLAKLLVIPRNHTSFSFDPRPYVFAPCGHVHCFRQRDMEKPEPKNCPTCEISSKPIKLCMGMESAFYVDYGPPVYAFTPCGHMSTEKTIMYWANLEVPHGINGFISICPFCAMPLDGWPGYVKLNFSCITDDIV